MTQEQITRATALHGEIRGHIVDELTYWLAAIKAGVEVEKFESRLEEIKGWKFETTKVEGELK